MYIKVYQEINIEEFEFWSGAKQSIERAEELGIIDEVYDLIYTIFSEQEEVTDTMINDFVWFELFDYWFDWETGERL